MNHRKQQGNTIVEYLLIAAAIFITWNFVDDVKKGLSTHQAEYTWSISQPNI